MAGAKMVGDAMRRIFVILAFLLAVIPIQSVSAIDVTSQAWRDQLEAYKSGARYFDIVENMPGSGSGGGSGGGLPDGDLISLASQLVGIASTYTYGCSNALTDLQRIINGESSLPTRQILAILVKLKDEGYGFSITGLMRYLPCAGYKGSTTTEHLYGTAFDIQPSSGDENYRIAGERIAELVGNGCTVGIAYPSEKSFANYSHAGCTIRDVWPLGSTGAHVHFNF